jgi:preprotein translocase SecF subunit
MFSIVEKRRILFSISAVVILLGFALMAYSTVTTGAPFRLSIDFVGGTIYEIAFTDRSVTEGEIRDVFSSFGDDVLIQQLGDASENRWSVRGSFKEQTVNDAIIDRLDELGGLDRSRLRLESVSETVGGEVARAAVIAVLVGGMIVTGFIVVAFRQVPHAIRYGLCAIIAMFHDLLIMMAFTVIMGLVAGWEIDALFITAVLTVVGFSVQDSIVMFDRIRENIPKRLGEPYETIVNRSILETMHRSLATQLNALFIMGAILLFGGETIRQFVAILFVGMLSGTYSSIFVAVPLLVSWQKGEIPLLSRGAKAAAAGSGG